MLKLYKNTIIACISGTILSVFVSALCLSSSHELASYLQNYAIGMACSLVVVILTTWLQYQHELENVFSKYCKELINLMFVLAEVYPKGLLDLESTDIDKIREKVDNAFQSLLNEDKQLTFFSKKKNKKQKAITELYGEMLLGFTSVSLKSKEAALLYLSEHKNFLPFLDGIEAMVPQDSQKEIVRKCRELMLSLSEN